MLENNQNFATFLLTFSFYFTLQPHHSIFVYFDQHSGSVHALLHGIVPQVSKANNMLSQNSVWLQAQKHIFGMAAMPIPLWCAYYFDGIVLPDG